MREAEKPEMRKKWNPLPSESVVVMNTDSQKKGDEHKGTLSSRGQCATTTPSYPAPLIQAQTECYDHSAPLI